jgi:glycosyltransferase involved in cell wall biosynthesis
MTVIESLACGTPVVGARIGGIPEQVTHGVNGMLFEPGDPVGLAEQMQYLLDNRAAAVEMGRAGRRQIETINGPVAHYEQTLAAYRSVLPNNTPERAAALEIITAK